MLTPTATPTCEVPGRRLGAPLQHSHQEVGGAGGLQRQLSGVGGRRRHAHLWGKGEIMFVMEILKS